MEIKSPGRMEGTILVPKARRRTTPNVRTTSPARPHASVVAFSGRFISTLSSGLRGFPAVMAIVKRGENLAAGQRRYFEYGLEPEGRSLVRLPPTPLPRLPPPLHVPPPPHV